MAEKNCRACAYSGLDGPDGPFVCGHPDSGTYGTVIGGYQLTPVEHCGPDHSKFEQHPKRHPDGSLKSLSQIKADEREAEGKSRRSTALDVLDQGER